MILSILTKEIAVYYNGQTEDIMERIAFPAKKRNKKFAEGFQRFYDVGGVTKRNYQYRDVFTSDNPFKRDRDSLSNDWNNVGTDLRNSINKFSEQLNG